ncbi:hypothetical protein F5Y04DRAFT_45677 [Hypomontagnella monticulosa]|nr:hypothetical protein F5Y04DRAFT_45677 [Hypomontagnella monticulosa]
MARISRPTPRPKNGVPFPSKDYTHTNNNGVSYSRSRPVAIVGMACRFAGDATSPSNLWDLCANGQVGRSPLPEAVDSQVDGQEESTERNQTHSGHFLKDNTSSFDVAFSNLPVDKTGVTDPQVRLLLESVYQATEDAGIPIENLADSNTAVFLGGYDQQYDSTDAVLPSYSTGKSRTSGASLVSNFFNLQGASMSIDTGSSSDLAALHQGCQTLRLGEADVSIIGACTLLNQDVDDGSESSDRGEGVAVLVIKSLDAALKDKDRIHAIIRNTGLNQSGKNMGTSPSAEAQIKLIEDCYRRAGLDMADTAYVEASMAGNEVANAAEIEALDRTFGKSRGSEEPIFVGSVKQNIGNTERVSGLAAIIKAALAMQNGLVAPSLDSNVRTSQWHVKVPNKLIPWPRDRKLRASINKFGRDGSNAHVIIDGAPNAVARRLSGNSLREKAAQSPDKSRVFVLSARDPTTAEIMAKNLSAHLHRLLESGQVPGSSSLAYTLATRRSRFPWTVTVRASNVPELATRLGEPVKAVHSTKEPRIGFVFNGQGAQWYAMGRELIAEYPVFRRAIEDADKVLNGYGATWSLYDELLRDESSSRVSQVILAQSVTVALQVCLVRLLESWGIVPHAVSSHSSGEVAAAYAAGLLSFKEALGVVYFRDGLLAKLESQSASRPGGMLAAGLGPDEVESYLANTEGGRAVIACVNSPESVTLAGDLAAINEVLARLEKDGIFARKLKVPLAYHSHHMLDMAQEYAGALTAILPRRPSWPAKALYASPVTGDIIESPDILTPEYWVQNLTDPVLFSQALEAMCFDTEESAASLTQASNVDMLVEIGPHSTLAGPIRQILKTRMMPYTSCLRRSENAVHTMQALAGELLNRGYPVSLKEVNFPLGDNDGPQTFVPSLPAYPWNHASTTESKATKTIRQRRFARHELLGTHLASSSGLVHEWRNSLRLSDIAWLSDHKVDSNVVLPGAGYVAMAVEAVRLLADPAEKSTRGYQLRDVEILSALVIPDSPSSVETHLRLTPCSEKELDYEGWYDFNISSMNADGDWVSNCKGMVSAAVSEAAAIAAPKVADFNEEAFFPRGTKARRISVSSLQSDLRKMGIEYGPAFQNLIGSQAAANKSASSMFIRNPMPKIKNQLKYVLHPTTLDSIIQATYSGLPDDAKRDTTLSLKSFRNLYISRDLGRIRISGAKLRAFADRTKIEKKGLTSSVTVLNNDANEGFLQIDGLFCQSIPHIPEEISEESEQTLCYKTHWEPDVRYRVPASVKESMRVILGRDDAEFEKKMVRASYYLIHDAVAELEGQNPESFASYQKELHKWMKLVVAQAKRGTLAPLSSTWENATSGIKQLVYDQLNTSGVAGRTVVRVGSQLAGIVRGEVSPRELLKNGNPLSQYFAELPRLRDRTYKQLSKVAEFYAVASPSANVLEIGAGTGGVVSQVILQAFGARGNGSGTLLGSYTYTDPQDDALHGAAQRLAPWGDMVQFQKLDIGQDLAKQSFKGGEYDLIVVPLALYSTTSVKSALHTIRSLLKLDGKLILIEPTSNKLDMQLLFGTSPEWWVNDEPDRLSPILSLQGWDDILRETGFTGVDFDIGDCEQPEFQGTSIILTGLQLQSLYLEPVSIVHTAVPDKQWLKHLSSAIRGQTGFAPVVESIENAQPEDRICIFTAEMLGPYLDSMGEKGFENLRRLFRSSRGVLWLSSGGVIDAAAPSFSKIQGLLRTLRVEIPNKRYAHLDFEYGKNPWSNDNIIHIIHVLKHVFDFGANPAGIDWEYSVKGSVLYVPRIYADLETGAVVSSDRVDPPPEPQPFFQLERSLVWKPLATNDPHNFCFVDNEELTSDIPAGMVEIEPKAFGLNTRDIPVDGIEETASAHDLSGIVVRLGPDTKQSGLKVGDRVYGLAKGRLANVSRASWTSIAKIPAEMSFETAAALPTAHITAYYSLLHVARLQAGESVLIHNAASDVGQAAITLAQYIGAKIFATCGTEAQKGLLVEKYGIDPTRVLSSKSANFARDIMAQTGGVGVDVALNSLSGSLLKATWECIASFGRLVDIGRTNSNNSKRLDMTPFRRSATYTSVDVLQLCEFRRSLVQEALQETLRICFTANSGRTIHPIRSYPISELEAAIGHVKEETHFGKSIIVPTEDDQVNVIPRSSLLSLNSQYETYMVAGSAGEVNHAITSWLIEKKAKNIVVVSHDAESSLSAAYLQQEAAGSGCNIHIRNCDIADEKSLVKLLKELAGSLPPIRGVVNTDLVSNATASEHVSSAGTWNLHKHLPDLSFFIMLSSIAGVTGHPSQATYAADQAFRDALARHRIARGLPAVSLDLPAITSAIETAQANEMTTSLDMDKVLRLVEAAVTHSLKHGPDDAQVIVGLQPWDQLSDATIARADPRFGTLQLAVPRATSSSTATTPEGSVMGVTPTDLLQQALKLSSEDSIKLATEAVAARLAELLNVDAEGIHRDASIMSHGVDSLSAVEIRNWLGTVAKAKVSIAEILRDTPLPEFAALVLSRSAEGKEAAA